MQRVMEVTKVDLFFWKTNPITIVVEAEGKVPTTGWTDAELGAWYYLVPPEDGVQDFDFIAREPDGMYNDVVTGITATAKVQANPDSYWGPGKPLNGVRVHAQNNFVEREVSHSAAASSKDPVVPWPWSR